MADIVQYDVEGYEVITDALTDLLAQFPLLLDGETIRFSTLDEAGGIAFYPASGSIVADEKRTITGRIDQLCNYAFYVVYRTAVDNPTSKVDVKEFLDNLGKWLEQQIITVDSADYELTEYPTLTGNYVIEEILRQSAAYLEATNENGVQDWVISLVLQYRNRFYPTKPTL